jgi:hypothetical protein
MRFARGTTGRIRFGMPRQPPPPPLFACHAGAFRAGQNASFPRQALQKEAMRLRKAVGDATLALAARPSRHGLSVLSFFLQAKSRTAIAQQH